MQKVNKMKMLFIGTAFCLICFAPWAVIGQPPDKPVSVVSPASNNASTRELSEKIAKVEEQLKEKKKDIWDKISSVSGLVSGVLIALIGAIATYIYNERQRQAERARNEREISVSQAQTIQSLIPHLTSDSPTEIRAALFAIEAMGNEDLATNLGRLFGGTGSLGALYRISEQRKDAKSKQAADDAIGDLLSAFKPSVVQLLTSDGQLSATGFFVDRDGHVITSAHVVHEARDFLIRTQDGKEFPAQVERIDKERDLAVLRCIGIESQPLVISELTETDQVAIIAHSPRMAWQVNVGTVQSLSLWDGRLIINMSGLQPEPGFSGAPAIDKNGNVIGMMSMYRTDTEMCLLISGDDIHKAFPDIVTWRKLGGRRQDVALNPESGII